MKGTVSIAVSCTIFLFEAGGATLAQDFASASDLGTTGLIDMPSARMQPDATFLTAYARQDVTDIYSMTYQATPWLETTFRYAIMDPRLDVNRARDDNRDRSYEIKVRLLKETELLPQVALGFEISWAPELTGENISSARNVSVISISLSGPVGGAFPDDRLPGIR